MKNSMSFGCLFLLLLLLLVGCKTRSGGTEIKNEENYIAEKFILVSVKDLRTLDGCEYIFETKNGEKLQPVNLSDTLKKDGLQIWIKYQPENSAGICMTGTMIRITEVKNYKHD
jgi:hypothetical protein